MRKTIAIVAGGDSSEAAVSLRSAEGIYSFMDKRKYKPYIVEVSRAGWNVVLLSGRRSAVDKRDFSFREGGERRRFDFAYITIHGTPGEDGLLQGYFELIGLPYSGCGVMASALTFDKFRCGTYLHQFNIVRPSSILLNGNESMDYIIDFCGGLPLFVKPNAGGSSLGITKVKRQEDLPAAINKAVAEGGRVLAEKCIDGKEVTCGCYKTKYKSVVFPLTEVVSKNEFFDYDAKYNGQSEEITPARLSSALTEEIQQTTLRIYDLLDAKGLIRVDYIIDREDGRLVVLEVNTTPGMTPASFIPQQVRAAGLKMGDVLSNIIENELNSR